MSQEQEGGRDTQTVTTCHRTLCGEPLHCGEREVHLGKEGELDEWWMIKQPPASAVEKTRIQEAAKPDWERLVCSGGIDGKCHHTAVRQEKRVGGRGIKK